VLASFCAVSIVCSINITSKLPRQFYKKNPLLALDLG
jgi:hypothetical protein